MEVERQNTPAQVISRAGRAGKPDLDGLDRGFLPGTCVLRVPAKASRTLDF